MPDGIAEPMATDDSLERGRDPHHRQKKWARLGLMVGAAALVGIAAYAGFRWWSYGRFVQDTNDAYLQADVVAVAPKVQGYVDQIFVTNNQAVVAGQPLLKIDASAYQARLAQQEAAVDGQRAAIAAAGDQIAQQDAAVDLAKAQLFGAEASLAFARGEEGRYRLLSEQGAETRERAAQALNTLHQAEATARAATATVTQAQRIRDRLNSQLRQSQAQLAGAEAEARNASLSFGDTLIRAAIDGRIGDKTVQIGQFVQAGTRLMSIVPTAALYLVANFKETQVGHMRVGQPASVTIDALDGRALSAVVDSFSPGTGATFALLPPQNATGNFTKIVQRVPVRLRLLVPPDLDGRLLAGLSASVKVDTGAKPASTP